MKPLISNVESFTLITADGKSIHCSREENGELFRLAIGGYGLFGLIDSVTLRLVPRQKLKRVVEIIGANDLPKRFEERITQNPFTAISNFQSMKNRRSFCNAACFPATNRSATTNRLSPKRDYAMRTGWTCYGSHTPIEKRLSSATAITICRQTDRLTGRTRTSSAHICRIMPRRSAKQIGGDESSLIITEIYVPRPDLPDFLAQAADWLRSNRTTVIYGTVRLIEKDDESFLAWAKQSYACIIFNLLTLHTPSGIEASARSFRGLIDLAIARGGSYYLTYHKFAKPEQSWRAIPNSKNFWLSNERTIRLNDFRAIGIAIIGSFSRPDEFNVMLSEATFQTSLNFPLVGPDYELRFVPASLRSE